MDPASGKTTASDTERRPSMRTSVRLSVVGDDDHDPHAVAIADGLRPTDLALSRTPNASMSTIVSHQDLPTPTSQLSPPSRRSSIAKPPHPIEPSPSRQDGVSGGSSGAVLSRESSMSTGSPMIQSERPYDGPSGPSHPYQMYPQRTLSGATTSTTPAPDGSYQVAQRPAHPYNMYPQSTVPVEAVQAQPIQVGFPGAQDSYRRQIGPEGEDVGSLIGPLGHTEELPPYTRYPEEAYSRKAGEIGETAHPVPVGAAVVPSSLAPQLMTGAGGIGLATRNPEFASTDDLASPRSRLSTRSFTSDSSQHEINTAARNFSEKPPPLKKWQQTAKKRVWGIVPYWAIGLLITALLLMGIVLGAVIGTFLTKHRHPPPHHNNNEEPATLPTSTIDTTPILTIPTGLPPLQIGTFSLPPLIASQAPDTCFNVTTQAQSWTCNTPFTVYSFEVDKLPNQEPVSDYSLRLTTPYMNGSFFTRYSWGAQPPIIPDPTKLILVNDTFEPSRGPAWWLQMPYNKTVILTEDRFSASTTPPATSKRRWGSGPHGPPGELRKGAQAAQDGDKPWICVWPQTILEVFIYPAQNNSYRPFASGSASASTAQQTSTATSTSISTPPASIGTSTTDTASPSGTSSLGDPSLQPPNPPPPYPKVIKFEERRYPPTSAANTATCRQVVITNNGQSYDPALDANGNPIVVTIVENQPSNHGYADTRRWLHGNDGLFYRDLPAVELTDCGCIWWFT